MGAIRFILLALALAGCDGGNVNGHSPDRVAVEAQREQGGGGPLQDCQVMLYGWMQEFRIHYCRDLGNNGVWMGSVKFSIKDSTGVIVLYDSLDVTRNSDSCIATTLASSFHDFVRLQLALTQAPDPNGCQTY